MTIDVQEIAGTGFVEIDLTGKLGSEDYKAYLPKIEELIRQHGKLRVVVQMQDFHGWTPGGLWQDIKFDAKHFKDLERIAFVGNEKWEEQMSKFCKPFTTAEVRFFDGSQLAEARRWLGT